MLQLILEPSANAERILKVFVLRLCIFKFKLVRLWIFRWGRQGIADFLFECLDLRNRPLHCNLKGIYGAFQPLEEVDLHHANEEFFTVCLAEGITGMGLIKRLELLL